MNDKLGYLGGVARKPFRCWRKWNRQGVDNFNATTVNKLASATEKYK